MRFLYQKLSAGWPFLALGLLLAGLWATFMIQSVAAQPAEDHNRQVSYTLALPNIMAPVIRKDLHKEAAAEDERLCNGIQLPALWQLFSVQK